LDRRGFFTKAGAAGAVVAAPGLARPALAQSQPRITWTLASSFPPGLDTLQGAAITLARHLSEATDGNFTLEVFAADELVPALDVADAVARGEIDIGHTVLYYYWEKDPVWAALSSVPFSLNARGMNAWYYHGGGLELANDFLASYGLIGFPMGNTAAQMGGWFRREVNVPADLQGLKFRVGGFAGSILSRLGVLPRQLPGRQTYEALAAGEIDAAEWVGPYDDEKMGFQTVAPYYYYPGWWEGGPTVHGLVSTARWAELPAAYQALFRVAAQATCLDMLAKYDAVNPPAIRRLVAAGVKLRPFSKEIMDASFAAANQTYAELMETNREFRTIWTSLTAFRRDFYLWNQVAELNYDEYMMTQQRAGGI